MATYYEGKQLATRSKARVQSHAEVFTPSRTVEYMLDMLERESPDVFQPGETFIEPTCGNGAFLRGIIRRKLANCRTADDVLAAVASIYGCDIMADNVEDSRATLLGEASAWLTDHGYGIPSDLADIIRANVVQADFMLLRIVLDDAADWTEAMAAYRTHFGRFPLPDVSWIKASAMECKRLRKTGYKASYPIVHAKDPAYAEEILERYAAKTNISALRPIQAV